MDLNALKTKRTDLLQQRTTALESAAKKYEAGDMDGYNAAMETVKGFNGQVENLNSMIAEAEKQVTETVGGIRDLADAEEKRLEAAKAATAKFLENVRGLIGKQLENIEAIASGYAPAEKAEAAPSVDEAVRSIESKVSRMQPAPAVQIDIDAAAPAEKQRPRKLDSTQTFSL